MKDHNALKMSQDSCIISSKLDAKRKKISDKCIVIFFKPSGMGNGGQREVALYHVLVDGGYLQPVHAAADH